jgi:Transposase domain (DUF772)
VTNQTKPLTGQCPHCGAPAWRLAYHSRYTLRSGQNVFVIRCRQCRKTFCDRFGTAFYDLKTPEEKVQRAIQQGLEGLCPEAVRGRIDWKYLLCLELENPGFDYSVLCEFRSRLLEGGAERRLFDKILSILREQKLVKDRTLQRTDSTHVLAAVRDMNRLERVVETMRAALNVLATVDPGWVLANIPAEWVDRYGHRTEESRLSAEDKET